MAKPESRRQRRIHRALQEYGHFYKIHGNEFQVNGIGDLVGCIDGFFFAFEIKEPNGFVSEAQWEEIDRVRRAGGIAEIITTADEAIAVVRKALTKAGRRLPVPTPKLKARRRRRFNI